MPVSKASDRSGCYLNFSDCPLEVEDLNNLAQIHDLSKEDAVDYPLFVACKKFISKVWCSSRWIDSQKELRRPLSTEL